MCVCVWLLCGALHEAYENNTLDKFGFKHDELYMSKKCLFSHCGINPDASCSKKACLRTAGSVQNGGQLWQFILHPRDEWIQEFLTEMITQIQETVRSLSPLETLPSLKHPDISDFVPMSPVETPVLPACMNTQMCRNPWFGFLKPLGDATMKWATVRKAFLKASQCNLTSRGH